METQVTDGPYRQQLAGQLAGAAS